jgi:hypothetical protein
VTDGVAGISRRRSGGGWTYFAPERARASAMPTSAGA